MIVEQHTPHVATSNQPGVCPGIRTDAEAINNPLPYIKRAESTRDAHFHGPSTAALDPTLFRRPLARRAQPTRSREY